MVTPTSAIPRIRPEALKALMDTGQAVTIVDAREAEDYFSSPLTILGAIQVPPDQIAQFYCQIPREQPVVVFCEGPPGGASTRVAQFLRSHGYADVRVLDGGFTAWEAFGYPTEPRSS